MSRKLLEPALRSPAALGYRWPAEWEPHAATWVSWPHNPETWPGKFEPVPEAFARLVEALAASEPVRVLAGGDAVMADARARLGAVERVEIIDIPTNDAWMRDHGPTFLVRPSAESPRLLVDWQYNAWGGKYPPFDLDNAVPQRIAEREGWRPVSPGIVLEGGAIEGDGQGTVLATPQCLLNPNRNPALSQEQLEQQLADYLAARKVLWLTGGGIAGDDTDGHIDQLARFVRPGVVVAAMTEDAHDENYEPLQANVAQLRRMSDARARMLEVVPLPMPRPLFFEQHRLPASYCNFYIANRSVLVPQYDDPADRRATEVLGGLFPERRIIGIPCLDLVWGLGAVHCLTQQEPLG